MLTVLAHSLTRDTPVSVCVHSAYHSWFRLALFRIWSYLRVSKIGLFRQFEPQMYFSIIAKLTQTVLILRNFMSLFKSGLFLKHPFGHRQQHGPLWWRWQSWTSVWTWADPKPAVSSSPCGSPSPPQGICGLPLQCTCFRRWRWQDDQPGHVVPAMQSLRCQPKHSFYPFCRNGRIQPQIQRES